MAQRLYESKKIKQVAFTRLKAIDWQIAHGPEITPHGPAAKRTDYSQVVLKQHLRDTLLPKLISGQLRVAEAERFLEEKGL